MPISPDRDIAKRFFYRSTPKSEIRKALGVSEPYSSDIRAGKRIPHPRHWQALAQLAGVSAG
jgi:hypothetical protein